MLVTVGALAARILSNPAANMLQKKLSETNSAILINLYSYLFYGYFMDFYQQILKISMGLFSFFVQKTIHF